MSDNSGSQKDQIKPVKLAHFVIRTTPEKFEEMAQWYLDLLNAKIAFKNAFSSFMTYDDEHHRAAVIAIPGLIPRPDNAVGVDHVAFTYGSLGDLLLNYERLAARGVEPVLPLHHGPTLSMYYQDPQKNQVELQVDAFETAEATTAFLQGKAFARNPIGVVYDPAELLKRYREGTPESELLQPLEGPPPNPQAFPAH